jgi:hypothetical protein
MRRLTRGFLSSLTMGISAVVVGVAVGYYVGFTEAFPLSGGVLAIIGLMLVGLLVAFYGGRLSGRADRPSASLRRSWDAFRRELDRARRFERTFVLLRIPAPEASGADGASGGDGKLGALPLVLRSIDQVWAMDGSIYIVLPEATRDTAHQVMGRLRMAMPDEPALEQVHMVEFPKDGVTTGALVANLRPIDASEAAAPVRLKVAERSPDVERTERTG